MSFVFPSHKFKLSSSLTDVVEQKWSWAVFCNDVFFFKLNHLMVASLFGFLLLLLLFICLFVSHELKRLNTCAYHTHSNNLYSILSVSFSLRLRNKKGQEPRADYWLTADIELFFVASSLHLSSHQHPSIFQQGRLCLVNVFPALLFLIIFVR